MIWRPRHPAFADCAWCHKPILAKHPPYMITKDQKIYGPYHTQCVDPATFKLDPEAWKHRHGYQDRSQLGDESR